MDDGEQQRTVAVIIPTFNRADVIGKTIDSVLGQTYRNIEIIVVDDGSTDDTRAVLAAYGDRIRYIYQDNAGPASARNCGARVAQADYIMFLDSDDVILPDKVARQVAYLGAHPRVDVVLCGWRLLGPDGVTVIKESLRFPVAHLLDAILLSGIYGVLPTGVPLMRRACFERAPGFDETLLSREEQDFWIQVLLAGCRFGMVKEVLCIFGDTAGSWGKDIAHTEQALPLIYGKVFDHNSLPRRVARRKNDAYARLYLQLGESYLARSGCDDDDELELARAYLARAMALEPRRQAWTEELLNPIPNRALALADGQDAEVYLAQFVDRLLPKDTQPQWLMGTLRGCLDIILALQAYRAGKYGAVPRRILAAGRRWPRLLGNRGTLAVLARSMVARVRVT